jgi:Arc/MetJ-type ribon-helix-helix transcriptional regulator
MAIVLSPEVEQQIQELVRSGKFASADEFIRWAVERDRDEQAGLAELAGREGIQRLLEEAEEDVRQGRVTEYDDTGLDALVAKIKAEGRKRLEMPAEPT